MKQSLTSAIVAIGLTITCTGGFAGADTFGPSDGSGKVSGVGNHHRVPLHFELNEGQTDCAVAYLARGPGYALFLTPDEMVFRLAPGAAPDGDETMASAVLRMKLEGADPHPAISGLDELLGKVNYFRGSDPAQWRTNISTYGKVRYHDVYCGIDLIHYGNQRQLEFDFVVSPQADPSVITLVFEGADGLEIDEGGDLVLHVGEGEVRQHKPVLYQEIDGRRREIAGAFELRGPDRVGFSIGDYDPTLQLVIDPTLVYGTYLGGASTERGWSIAVNGSGEACVVGHTVSTDFPVTPGAYDTSREGTSDLFVAKLSADGTALIFSTYLGGSLGEGGTNTQQRPNIAVADDGSAFVCGTTASSDFPVTPGAFDTTLNPGGAGFVTRLTPDGSGLIYSTFMQTINSLDVEFNRGIAVDSDFNAYACGNGLPANNGIGSGQGQIQTITQLGATAGVRVCKIEPQGRYLKYCVTLGPTNTSSGDQGAQCIAIDSLGCAVVESLATSTGAGLPVVNAV
ncbi:MAG TPA: hypothetical protein VJZ71_08235 [Phycisphaerae bacterium]|nr:hypothetical protein [Phycisphaerae bacterium]